MNTAPAEIATSVVARRARERGHIAPGQVEEDQVCRGVVEKRRQRAGQPEYSGVVRASVRPLTSATSGASAPSLPARSIAIAGVIVMKMPANSFATSTIGAKLKWFAARVRRGVSRQDAHAIARRPRRARGSATRRRAVDDDFEIRLPDARQKHDASIAPSSRKLTLPSMPVGGIGRRVAEGGIATFQAPEPRDRARRTARAAARSQERRQQHRLRRPEEIARLEEAQEERRVAKRCQRAADVRDQEDEEHDDVRAVAAVVVRAQQRADQQHRRARRAHDAREYRAERQQRVFCHAEPRRLPRTCRPPDTVNSANSRMMNGTYSASSVCTTSRARDAETEVQRERNEQRERPERRRLPEVVMPETGRGHRHQRDRQQDAGERHDPQRRQRRAVQPAGGLRGGGGQRGEGAKEGEREARHGETGE
jgi:hypothetical protein